MSNIYYRRSFRTGRPAVRKYFKILSVVLAIVILFFIITGLSRLVSVFTNTKTTKFENSAVVYLAEGSNVQKQNYGSAQFLPVLSGDMVLQGDTIRTLDGTKAVLEFSNGLVARVDSGTVVEILKLVADKADQSIDLHLKAGRIWLNKPVASNLLSLNVQTDYLKVNSLGTVFAVKSGLPEEVQVFEGTVLVDVIGKDAQQNSVTYDQVKLLADQMLELDNAAYVAFSNREVPRVLKGISQAIRNSAWVRWNLNEDKNPSKFQIDNLQTTSDLYVEQTFEVPEVLDEDLEGELKFSNPIVTFPANNQVISENRIEILGTVPQGTQAVVITSYESGAAVPYVLKEFKPGDTKFRYIAVYDENNTGNLRLGLNRFSVMAISEQAEESEVIEVEFILDFGASTEESAAAETASAVGNLEFNEDLAAPVIKSVNGQVVESGFRLIENRGEVVGSIGKWAKSVVINGYKLQRFEPFSGEFVYILSEGFNTLKAGQNKLLIYGFDAQGRRGMPVEFIINH